jgi:hypothetical protein
LVNKYFEEDKKEKLDRLIGLRIMNFLGMISWKESIYQGADQKIRLLHPFSWIWILLVVSFGIIAYGIIEVSKEFKDLWKNETVWW